jgi:capsid protein
MSWHWLWEPLAAFWAKKKLERLQCTVAAQLLESTSPQRVEDDPDAAAWRLLGGCSVVDDAERETIRDKARHLADFNPYARNALTLYRNYVVGLGMKQEVRSEEQSAPELTARVQTLWKQFLAANEWDTGHRKDWEFCHRTWRDGECFLRMFRQPTWPPRVHFVDPERIAADPATGLPSEGIATDAENVEIPLAYHLQHENRTEALPAERMLHAKIGVDGNVKRGLTLLLPVLDALKRFQGWLDVELIHRKVSSSIVLVRKHQQNYAGGVTSFADSLRTNSGSAATRKTTLQPGTIIDAQGFDLQFLSPNSHFEDASLLGRMILLAIAAGTGLPEFMLTSDASNANYASTLVAEGPAVRHFASWQAFFIGQWQKLFRMVMSEAVRLGYLTTSEVEKVSLHLIPPTLAVRNRHVEALADAVYFDRGAISRQELARRDRTDPAQMQQERGTEQAKDA